MRCRSIRHVCVRRSTVVPLPPRSSLITNTGCENPSHTLAPSGATIPIVGKLSIVRYRTVFQPPDACVTHAGLLCSFPRS